MTTDELESILEARAESQSLDFKGDCSWNANKFAKHILAMSNLIDSGLIVIGIKDKTLERLGVSKPNLKTYNIDCMKDQMTKFADPFVDFILDFPKDKSDKQFVVI